MKENQLPRNLANQHEPWTDPTGCFWCHDKPEEWGNRRWLPSEIADGAETCPCGHTLVTVTLGAPTRIKEFIHLPERAGATSYGGKVLVDFSDPDNGFK